MRLSVPAGKNEKTAGLSTATVGRFASVVALSGELFDAIEVNAARTGNHKRAAVRMGRLAAQAKATPVGMSRAEAHMRAGEQWSSSSRASAAGTGRQTATPPEPPYSPVTPSRRSRSRSAWPRCRARHTRICPLDPEGNRRPSPAAGL
jgi:hypothetical protein